MRAVARTKRWLFMALIGALIGASAIQAVHGVSARAATPVPPAGTGTVSVNGAGVVNVAPDSASISVGVNVIQPTLTEAQAQATSQMTTVIDALKAAGIADEDIQTTNYSVNIIQDYDTRGNPATITGFQVNNQVSVIVRDLTSLGAILDTAVAAGANSIYGISFMVSDPTAATSQARRLAIEHATQKAREIAEATGTTLGLIVSVTEGFSVTPMPYGGFNVARDEAMAAVPIEGGMTAVTVEVQMVFELVQ